MCDDWRERCKYISDVIEHSRLLVTVDWSVDFQLNTLYDLIFTRVPRIFIEYLTDAVSRGAALVRCRAMPRDVRKETGRDKSMPASCHGY